jgi:molybdopterin synthase sulfur carrier subunit
MSSECSPTTRRSAPPPGSSGQSGEGAQDDRRAPGARGVLIIPTMATIKIPPVLRASVGGEKEVSASGENVGDVLRDLASSHPATQSQLFSAEGELNRYVKVYLKDEDVRVLDGLGTAVGDGDVLVILPAMAGGLL